MKVSFTLRSKLSTSVELLDVTGRRVAVQELGTLGPGRHTVDIRERSLEPGIYFVRLEHGRDSRMSRVAVLN